VSFREFPSQVSLTVARWPPLSTSTRRAAAGTTPPPAASLRSPIAPARRSQALGPWRPPRSEARSPLPRPKRRDRRPGSRAQSLMRSERTVQSRRDAAPPSKQQPRSIQGQPALNAQERLFDRSFLRFTVSTSFCARPDSCARPRRLPLGAASDSLQRNCLHRDSLSRNGSPPRCRPRGALVGLPELHLRTADECAGRLRSLPFPRWEP
jgi:hypothetical protein